MAHSYRVPGVYIEDRMHSGLLTGVPTSITAFVGPAISGDLNTAQWVTNYDEWLDYYAVAQPDGTRSLSVSGGQTFYLAHALKGFFLNGGTGAYVVRIGRPPEQPDEPFPTVGDYEAGLDMLQRHDVNLVCIPDSAVHPERIKIQQAMIKHCLDMQDRFAILDPPDLIDSIEEHRVAVQSDRGVAALYYPWVEVRDPTSTEPTRGRLVPPSGHIAGVYARTDSERGVHRAPANMAIEGAVGLQRRVTDGQIGALNKAGVNVLRIFPGSPQVVVWGARTTADPGVPDWLYVNVRRVMLYIEASIAQGVQWAVFEPNNTALREKLKRTVDEFLTRVWRRGALAGATAEQAFYVRIDEALNTPSRRAQGQLVIEIGVAPMRPTEFIIVHLHLWDGGAEVVEA